MLKRIFVSLIMFFYLFICVNSQVPRKRFEYNGACITIDSIGSQELKSYMQTCKVERDCTWIDSIYKIDFDTIVSPELNYWPCKRSKSFYLFNANHSDTIEISSSIDRYLPILKFIRASQSFGEIIKNYDPMTEHYYKKDAEFFSRDVYDTLFYNELSQCEIGNGMYDFSNMVQKHHLFSKSRYLKNPPKILYSYNFKEKKAYYNFIYFFKSNSPLYEILIKYHGEISTKIYTDYFIISY